MLLYGNTECCRLALVPLWLFLVCSKHRACIQLTLICLRSKASWVLWLESCAATIISSERRNLTWGSCTIPMVSIDITKAGTGVLLLLSCTLPVLKGFSQLISSSLLSIPVSVLVPGLAYSIAPLKVKVNIGVLRLYCKPFFCLRCTLAHATLHLCSFLLAVWDLHVGFYLCMSSIETDTINIHSAALIYYVICVYISPPVDSLSEVAVYPPKTIEEEQDRLRSLGRTSTLEVDLDTPSDEKKQSDFV